MRDEPIRVRLGWAGGLIAAGLIVQLATLAWMHPLAFVAFIAVSGPLVVAGMAVYLWTLASRV